MLEINRILGTGNVLNQGELKKVEQQQEDVSLLEQGGGVDTVSFSSGVSESEKFSDVRAEMEQNVPDITTTIEEKELAISYIDRMLACSDISPELKEYWTEKKTEIEQEIQAIKAMEANSGVADKEENIFATKSAAYSILTEYIDKYKSSVEKEIEQVTSLIQKVDKDISNIEAKLSKWFYRTFSGRSLNNQLDAAKRRKEELQAKLNALNEELNRIDKAKENGGIGHEDVLVEYANKYRQTKEEEAAKLKEEIAEKDKEIEEIENALTKWFYRTFFKRGYNNDLENLRRQKAELQVKLDAVNEEIARIDSAVQEVS